MPLLFLLVGVSSIALALNIGANNTAAEMGPAYGAGVRTRRQVVWLIAIFCPIGAIAAGGRVLHTMGHGLIGSGTLAANTLGVLVVVLSALAMIGLANALRLPLSTAHVVAGSTVGLGLFYHSANLPLVAVMVVWWVATPLASFIISYLAGRLLYPRLIKWIGTLKCERLVHRGIIWCITASGCWMAFSAGSNSLAKALGPAVGAGVFSPIAGAVAGGLAMAAGAVLLGARTLQTVGKEIHDICPLCAILVEVTSASIIFVASRFGIPVSLTEIVTCSVIGFSWAANGTRKTSRNPHLRRILVFWPTAPVAAGAITFGLLAIR